MQSLYELAEMTQCITLYVHCSRAFIAVCCCCLTDREMRSFNDNDSRYYLCDSGASIIRAALELVVSPMPCRLINVKKKRKEIQ